MIKKILIYIFLTVSTNIVASTATERLQQRLTQIHTLTANFTQEVSAKGRLISQSSGNMALQRPGLFRWATKEPMAQLVIADGQHLWVYDPDLEQVTVKKQEKGLGGTAALFLSGYDENLSRDFSVSLHSVSSQETFDLKANSSKANFQRLKLIFTQQQLVGLELWDQLGQHTLVHLNDIRNNPKLNSQLFKFIPPKGVDVVQQ